MLQDDDEEGLGLPPAQGGEDLLDDIISMTPGDPWFIYDDDPGLSSLSQLYL